MKKYYDILEIGFTKDKKLIKKAYAKMVKRYRPETEPAKFQEVRNAYDTILDYISKAPEKENKLDFNTEYKVEKKQVDRAKKVHTETDYIEKAEEYKSKVLYDEAIEMYEKALLKAKDDIHIINEIGVLYYDKGDIGNAIKQFNKAILINSKSDKKYSELDTTYNNLAQLYIRNKQYDLARKNYIKAYEIEEDTRYIKGILNTYKESREGEKLFEALIEYDFNKEESVPYYIECVKFALERYLNSSDEDDKKILEDTLSKILVKYANTEYAKDMCDGIHKIGSLLFDKGHIELAELLVEYGINIYKLAEIQNLKNRISNSYEQQNKNEQLNKVISDRRIHPEIIELIISIKNKSDNYTIKEIISNMKLIDVKDLMSDIEVIEYEYNLLYESSKHILDEIVIDKKTKIKYKKVSYLVGIVLILYILQNLMNGNWI